MEKRTACIFGHRTINETETLKKELLLAMERLIVDCGVNTFLFGSRSEFDSLCLVLVTELKKKYPHVRRIYVRAEYPVIQKDYETLLRQRYDETYYPETLLRAGRAVYVERNREMIRRSRYCIVYYEGERVSYVRKSGTRLALTYAKQQGKELLLFPRADSK